MSKIEKHIADFKNVHGKKYDYSKAVYVDWNTKIEIICSEHGPFWQRISHHKKGTGCPECNPRKKMTFKRFKQKANKVWGEKYKYKKETFKDSQSNIIAICDEHGEFEVNVQHHLRTNTPAQGCPKCAKKSFREKKLLTKDDVVKKFKSIHGDKINYIGDYLGMNVDMEMECSTHGIFKQTPSNHLKSTGCPLCAQERHQKLLSKSKKDFIKESIIKHGEKFDYSQFQYINNKTKGEIICPKHGSFLQTPQGHAYFGHGCPKCVGSVSKAEIEISELLNNWGVEHNISNRTIIPPQEIDIIIPNIKLGIEYNGLFYHREGIVEIAGSRSKPKNYHLDKTLLMNKNGWKLIHIFEDEWTYNKPIIISKIKNLVGVNDVPKIYARKCSIKEIEFKACEEFLNKNHIQGSDMAGIRLGAFYDDNMVAVMTFLKDGFNCYKLNRFAADNNYKVIGIGGKLLKHFERQYTPTKITTFADRRWTLDEKNNLYTKLGFELVNSTAPNYFYFDTTVFQPMRESRVKYQKHKLLKDYPQYKDKTEKEIMSILGYDRIFDCGNFKFEKYL